MHNLLKTSLFKGMKTFKTVHLKYLEAPDTFFGSVFLQKLKKTTSLTNARNVLLDPIAMCHGNL